MSEQSELWKQIHQYAVTFAEIRYRRGSRPFSTRQKFDPMTDDEVGDELDRLKAEIMTVTETTRPADD